MVVSTSHLAHFPLLLTVFVQLVAFCLRRLPCTRQDELLSLTEDTYSSSSKRCPSACPTVPPVSPAPRTMAATATPSLVTSNRTASRLVIISEAPQPPLLLDPCEDVLDKRKTVASQPLITTGWTIDYPDLTFVLRPPRTLRWSMTPRICFLALMHAAAPILRGGPIDFTILNCSWPSRRGDSSPSPVTSASLRAKVLLMANHIRRPDNNSSLRAKVRAQLMICNAFISNRLSLVDAVTISTACATSRTGMRPPSIGLRCSRSIGSGHGTQFHFTMAKKDLDATELGHSSRHSSDMVDSPEDGSAMAADTFCLSDFS